MFLLNRKEDYEDSRSIQMFAYSALLDYEVKELPVMPREILRRDQDVYLITEQTYALRNEFSFEKVHREMGDWAVAYYDGHYYIYYNDDCSEYDVRWFLSCAIACIELDLVTLPLTKCSFLSSINDSEKAERFTYVFTAPDAVLKRCALTSAKDVIQYCRIPFQKAFKKSRLLQKRSKKQHTIDRLLLNNFQGFIKMFGGDTINEYMERTNTQQTD